MASKSARIPLFGLRHSVFVILSSLGISSFVITSHLPLGTCFAVFSAEIPQQRQTAMANYAPRLLEKVERPRVLSERTSSGRRLERRVGYLLWSLAVACLLLAALVWWRLLTGVP
jgi:hypothetical protein